MHSLSKLTRGIVLLWNIQRDSVHSCLGVSGRHCRHYKAREEGNRKKLWNGEKQEKLKGSGRTLLKCTSMRISICVNRNFQRHASIFNLTSASKLNVSLISMLSMMLNKEAMLFGQSGCLFHSFQDSISIALQKMIFQHAASREVAYSQYKKSSKLLSEILYYLHLSNLDNIITRVEVSNTTSFTLIPLVWKVLT
jgi:hypothetical protein